VSQKSKINRQLVTDTEQPHIQSVVGKYGRTYYFREDMYVGRSVFQYGEFSPEECSYILDLASEKKGTVLDIGANIGCITQALVAAGHTVQAWEPQPEVYNLLARNCGNIATLHNCALGSSRGIAFMPKVDYSKVGNFGGLGIGSGTLEVEVMTLDSYQFQDISLMKIDVEGFEEEVLRGATETIGRCKPIIYLEADRQEKLKSLANYLAELGYSITEHAPPLFSPNNFYNNPKRAWDKNYVSLNWVCRPK
jgi:FkbM family methyltransferase